MKMFNIEEFEFSQSYLFFWDKVRTILSLVRHKPQTGAAPISAIPFFFH